MRSKKREKKYIFNNLLSIAMLLIFIMLELFYFNIIPNSSFNDDINNLPKNTCSLLNNYLLHITTNNNGKELRDHAINSTDSKINTESENLDNSQDNNKDTSQIHEYNDLHESTIQDTSANLEEKDIGEEIAVDDSLVGDDEYETTISEDSITKRKLKYESVSLDYFNNTLFIGDSRMAGFEIFMRIPGAMYFCYSSASVFNIFENEDEVAPIGKIKLFDLLTKQKFDKIYIMLGINNLQTNYYNHKKQYKETLDKIKKLQPQAIIYLIANLHVTDVFDPTKPHLTNENVNLINEMIKGLADETQTFYLDPNPMFDDENGNLKLELSTDNVHIHVTHYDKFLVYLLSNALVEDTSSANVIVSAK